MQLPSAADNLTGGGSGDALNIGGGATSNSDVKVVESKTICYCSNFDLNVNEWFNEYENIEIFKLNLKRDLSKYQTILARIGSYLSDSNFFGEGGLAQ